MKTTRSGSTRASHFLCLLGAMLVSAVLQAAEADVVAATVRQLADRAAIQEVVVRYIQALDTRDADLYVSVFTEDAEYDIEGDVRRGHDAMRAIITGLQAARDANDAAGRPNVDLYHAVLNSSITLIDEDEAVHRGYWQTLRKSDENIMIIGGMGIEEEQLVKQNGEWRIKKRTLTNFIQRRPQ